MNTITIDRDKAIELLERAIAEKGADYRYPAQLVSDGPACFYARGGEPSCIVGHALHYAGVPIEQVAALDIVPPKVNGVSSGTGIAGIIDEGRLPEGVEVTPEARLLLKHVQSYQDDGYEWGMALNEAKRSAR